MRSRMRLGRHLAVAGLILALPAAGAAGFARIDESVTARGRVDFTDLTPVTARVSARIEEVHCREGQPVRRGEVLFLLDDEPFLRARERWDAEREVLRAKEARLRGLLETLERERHPREVARERAELELLRSLEAAAASQRDRRERLGALVAAEEMEIVRRGHEAARLRRKMKEGEIRSLEARQRAEREETARSLEVLSAERKVWEARLPLLERDVEDTRIRAPIDGWVITPNPERLRGRVVPPGERIVEIADPAKVRLVLAVDERDMNRVRPGQTARVHLDAFPYYLYGSLRGRVAEVGPASEPDDRGRLRFRVLVTLDELPERAAVTLRPGLSGEGVLILRPRVGLGTYLFRRLTRDAPGTTTWY